MSHARLRWTGVLAALTVAAAAPAALAAQSDWCAESERDDDRFCEVREFTLAARGSLSVDARPNGGIRVTAWDRNEIRVLAKVSSRADSRSEAQDLVSEVSIDTNGTIRATGPRTGRGESWYVSYRISVPARTNLDLASTNGGLGVEGVRGTLALETTNGGIGLRDLGGDVTARTTNGGITVSLSGPRWDGEGLEAITTNGGVELNIPDGYSADLEVGTRNGGLSIDFPVTVSGRIRRTISTELGSGGAPVRVRTTNGGVQVRRAG